MNERRSHVRLLDSELVIVSWRQGSETTEQIGNIENLSADGIGVLIDQAIPINTAITISYDGEDVLTGTVRHQSRDSGRFLIGIEFNDASRNSTLHFQPEFLTRE